MKALFAEAGKVERVTLEDVADAAKVSACSSNFPLSPLPLTLALARHEWHTSFLHRVLLSKRP